MPRHCRCCADVRDVEPGPALVLEDDEPDSVGADAREASAAADDAARPIGSPAAAGSCASDGRTPAVEAAGAREGGTGDPASTRAADAAAGDAGTHGPAAARASVVPTDSAVPTEPASGLPGPSGLSFAFALAYTLATFTAGALAAVVIGEYGVRTAGLALAVMALIIAVALIVQRLGRGPASRVHDSRDG